MLQSKILAQWRREMNMSDLTVIIPAYNEEASLRSFLPQIFDFCDLQGCCLFVVNDGSRDGTKDVLDSYEDRKNFKSIHHKLNKGYGEAIKSGLMAVKTKYCITIDADGQHSPEDICRLYALMTEQDADLVIGRRSEKWKNNPYRFCGKRIIRWITKMLMPLDVQDINSGMKMYRTELARAYAHLCPSNMPFSDIITLYFVNQRHLVLETPINISPRVAGVSTINTITAFETIMEILHIVTFFNPMRVFLPVALVFLTLSALWGVPIILRGEGVSVGTLFLFVTGMNFFFLGLIAEQLSIVRKKICIDPVNKL
ncbi:MAG TPA: hypothetical protein DEB25_08985 [Desulfobulbaceae bacterium]|nr:hypothetical protein [Desulfobulbaceae bacterium]